MIHLIAPFGPLAYCGADGAEIMVTGVVAEATCERCKSRWSGTASPLVRDHARAIDRRRLAFRKKTR